MGEHGIMLDGWGNAYDLKNENEYSDFYKHL